MNCMESSEKQWQHGFFEHFFFKKSSLLFLYEFPVCLSPVSLEISMICSQLATKICRILRGHSDVLYV